MTTVSTTIKNKTVAEVWEFFTNPKHVINWNFAGDDWHCPKAENQLEVGKSFTYRMEAKNGETGFDFTGIYTEIEPFSKINYILEDVEEEDQTELEAEMEHLITLAGEFYDREMERYEKA